MLCQLFDHWWSGRMGAGRESEAMRENLACPWAAARGEGGKGEDRRLLGEVWNDVGMMKQLCLFLKICWYVCSSCMRGCIWKLSGTADYYYLRAPPSVPFRLFHSQSLHGHNLHCPSFANPGPGPIACKWFIVVPINGQLITKFIMSSLL